MIYSIVILSVLLLVAILVIVNLFRKLDNLDNILEGYEVYLSSLCELIEESNKIIDIADSKGHFRTDDEIEGFFDVLKEVQTILNKFNFENISSQEQEPTYDQN